MRLKQQRNARRRLAFYRATYGFRPPFKVLLDGTAVQTSINLKMNLKEEVCHVLSDAKPSHVASSLLKHFPHGKQLSKMLGSNMRMFVPKAVIKELEALGKGYETAVKVARQLKVLPSNGSTSSASEALLGLIGKTNPEKYCVLTEDPSLQNELSHMLGVPLLRFARQKLVLAIPAERLATAAETSMDQASRTHPCCLSALCAMGFVQHLNSCSLHTQMASKPTENERASTTSKVHNGSMLSDQAHKQRRRKGPKQPNPLSIKKKKKKSSMRVGGVGAHSQSATPPRKGNNTESEASGGHRRKRKRGGGNRNLQQ